MAEKKTENTAAVVAKLAKPIAEELGLSLWDVRFLKEGGAWYLRIFIDKEDGVGIEDCEMMSRAVDGPLDELDPIDQAYCLEVCSPGIGRELTRPEHFTAYCGKNIRVRLIRPNEENVRELDGTLLSYSEGTLIIKEENTGKEISVLKKDASYIRANDDLEVNEK